MYLLNKIGESIMKVPYIKAIDKDTGKEVQGFYFVSGWNDTMCGFLHNDRLGIA